jgi:glycosyltransferase involved in cell wall biosynthesis
VLSVIFPTRNRADLLEAALNSLWAQTLPRKDFEVLIVDNGSTDKTRDVAWGFARKFGAVRYFFEATPGLHAGRHRGLREAKGEVLVFADDDIEAMPTWLEAIVDSFSNGKVALVGGNNLPKFEASPPDWLIRLWEKPVMGGHAIPMLSVLELPEGSRQIDPMYIWGCNFSVRKDILLKAGGFHPDGMPDNLIRFRGDGETHVARFVGSAGLLSVFNSRASVRHLVTKSRMTLRYFEKRAFNQGVSDSYTDLRDRVGPEVGRGRWPTWSAAKVRVCMRQLRMLARGMFGGREYCTLWQRMAAGYRAGYNYHQEVYLRDEEVCRWVHRETYFP